MSPRLLFFVASHFALPQKEGGPPASCGKTPDRRDGAWRRGRFLPAAFLRSASSRTLFAGGPAKKGRGGAAL